MLFIVFFHFFIFQILSFKIKENRPRILIDDITKIRKVVLDDLNYPRIKRYLQRRIDDPTGTRNTLLYENYPHTVAINSAFVALISQEQTYIDLTLSYVDILVTANPDDAWDTGTRYRLLAMAYLYDWMFDYLSETQKTNLRNSMWDHLQRCISFIDSPNFNGGHSKLGNHVCLVACIALSGEDSRFDEIIDRVVSNFKDGFNPVMDYAGKEGGHYMGWNYGGSYARLDTSFIWYRATGSTEVWVEEFLKNFGYFLLYPYEKNQLLPMFGDCWSDTYSGVGIQTNIAVSAALGRNRYAAKFDEICDPMYEANQYFRLILKKDYPEPAETYDVLSKVKNFQSSGFVVSRNTWNITSDPVIFTFKSSPFISRNHHHFDQNSFTLSYKGPLLLDTGIYDAYGTEHWYNYYIRTIAHNSMVVYLENEDSFEGKSNDGGQKLCYTPRTVDSIIEGGENHLDGITEFSELSDCWYVKGDASKAYSSEKVNQYTREILMVHKLSNYDLPIIMIVDTVKLNKTLSPRILWHLPTKPTLDKNSITWSNINRNSFARLEFLYPHNKEIEVYDSTKKYYVDGINYPPSTEHVQSQIAWGRIEVKDSNVDETVFISLLTVDDGNTTDFIPEKSILIEKKEEFYGSVTKNAIFLTTINSGSIFNLDNEVESSLLNQNLKEIFIIGLESEQCARVIWKSQNYMLKATTGGLASLQNSEKNKECIDPDALIFSIISSVVILSILIVILVVITFFILVFAFMKSRDRKN